MKTIFLKIITLSMAAVLGLSTIVGSSTTVFAYSNEGQTTSELTDYELEKIEEFANEENSEYVLKDASSSEIQPRGKAGLTLKAAQKLIKKNAKKIDSAIDTAIYKIPGIKTETKKNWTKNISAIGIAKYLGSVTGAFDSAEEAVNNYLTESIGVPNIIATPVVKTVFFIIT